MKKKSKKGFFTKVFKAFKQDCKQAKEFIGSNTINELDKMFKNGSDMEII
jgi:hypothetical protein